MDLHRTFTAVRSNILAHRLRQRARESADMARRNRPFVFLQNETDQPCRGIPVDFPMRHVAETAPFPTPPLDLDENEHASRRISTPLITMGVIRSPRAAPFDVLM